jgi:hypothetical protein
MKRESRIASTGPHPIGANPPRRELFQYDGSRFIGTIVVNRDGTTKAFNGARKGLGSFPDFRVAMAAISAAHISAQRSAA